MSYQHLYSRVPARVSLFNKRDGFDTFAHSSELSPSLILGELSLVYLNRLDIYDPLRIRRGELSPVYSQIRLPSGMMAQTAVSYAPVDFTGERSAYFAHTLVLTEEEMTSVLGNPLADCFNPGSFYKDISRFNITSRLAAPNPAFPKMDYIIKSLSDHRATVGKYDGEMVKGLIYAILCSICGGNRSVFFRLPCSDKDASAEALSLLNAIMSVLPYTLREEFSFVSYVSRVNDYPYFKIKCLDSSVQSVPSEAGAFYDFANNTVSGAPDGYENNASLVSFLYSLFEYPKIREQFLPFVSRITEKYGIRTIDIDTLRDIVFLFWQCSGFYVEQTVVPDDDSLCNLMDVYARFREGLLVEHRVRVYRPLNKYTDTHTAIPDSVFSRLSRLYPEERVEAKAVALDVLLRLIHVDLMRDSLFCFITRYYDGETDAVKAVINEDLSRVFYGGFLQPQIIAFFDAHFRAEPVATRDIVLEKLLLSIRTPEIQAHIVTFLDRHYPAFNSTQKMKVCTTCLEMVPECDMLSTLLVSLINRRIGREKGDITELMANNLTLILAQHLARGDGRLAAIFTQHSGFCEDITFRYALESGVGIEILVSILAGMPAHIRGDKLLKAYKATSHLSPVGYLDFLLRFTAAPVVVAPSGLRDLLRLDKMASAALPADVAKAFRERIIYPVIAYVFADVFKADYGKDGLSELLDYAEKNPLIKGHPQYMLIVDYLELVRKCELGETEGAFKIASRMPDFGDVRGNIGRYIKSYNLDLENQDEETSCTYQLIASYLTDGSFDFDLLYDYYQREFEDSFEDESGFAKGFMADRKGAASAISLILGCATDICNASQTLATLVRHDDSGLREAVTEFVNLYGLGAGGVLKKHLRDSDPDIEEICDEVITERNKSIKSVGDAVDLIFKRK